MIQRRHGQFRPSHLTAGQTQAFERLGAGDFVNQVQIDVQERLLPRLGMHHVCIPDFFEHRARHGRSESGQWSVDSGQLWLRWAHFARARRPGRPQTFKYTQQIALS